MQLGEGGVHLSGEDVAEGGEGAHLAARELVHAADALDELARVDVWVAPVLDVLHEEVWYAGPGLAEGVGGGVDCAEGFGEGLSGGREEGGWFSLLGSGFEEWEGSKGREERKVE